MNKPIIALIAMFLSITSVSAQCIDFDNGALSYVASYAKEDGAISQDYCLPNGNVMEQICDDDELISEEMHCMRGCGINWEGYGACKPTAMGRTASDAPLPGGSSGGGGGGSIESFQVFHMPEFSTAAAVIALSGAIGIYLLVSRR